jgi:protein TonB
MSAAAAALRSVTPGDLRPPNAGLWTIAFAAVLALHLAVGTWLLSRSPETGPVAAPEPIAMIDLPPAPVLPDAVSSQALPPSDVVDIAPPTASTETAGSIAPDLAHEAVEVEGTTAETLPPTTAEPPPPSDVPPLDAPLARTAPTEPAAPPTPSEIVEPLAAVPSLPLETPLALPEDAAAVAAEPPLEAVPLVPDAAVALPSIALPPEKPAVVPRIEPTAVAVRDPAPAEAKPPPAVRDANKLEARKPAETKKPAMAKAERTTEKTAEKKAAAKKAAGPAADKQKAGTPRTGSAPRAAGGGPAADALRQYQAKVRADIEREVRRTPVSRTGVAAIRFTFSRTGALSGAAVARSSGDPAIDRAALQAVKRASPFPAAPADLSQPNFTLTVPIRIR